MPTLAVLAAAAALASGVVLSTVEARHHKSSSHRGTAGTATPDQTVLMQQAGTADTIKAMKLGPGLQHSTVCPRAASSVDACFTGTLSKPATDPGAATSVASQMLGSLDVALGPAFGCDAVSGGPWGSGYDCTATGTWHSAPVNAFVFVSSEARTHAGAPRLDAMLTVLPTSR